MTTLTNRLRLPEPIVAAIANDPYTKGKADISVTELLLPPQLRALRVKHNDEIVEDVSDRIWSLLGQAVHTIIERAGDGLVDQLGESTLTSSYLGWTIKGTFDNVALTSSELQDFKVTTAWKLLREKTPPEWVQQTNIYRRLLFREKGLTINSICVIAILRDWSKLEASRNQDYPQAQVIRVEIPLWTPEQTDAFIEERLHLHQATSHPPCTDEEIWAKPTTYAVMKKGAARATRVFHNRAEADSFSSNVSGSSVEERPGVATRCQHYCPVSFVCPQWAVDPRRSNNPSTAEGLFT